MEFEIPTIPLGIIALLNFILPYFVAVITDPRWTTTQKKWVAVISSIVATAVVILLWWWLGEPLPAAPVLILLAIAIQQASYSLFLKSSAKKLEQAVGVGVEKLQ